MHRFFVSPNAIQGQSVHIRGAQAHQIDRVLRLTVGEQIAVLDNAGWLYRVALTQVTRALVVGQIEEKTAVTTEPQTHITLYQSLLKRDKFEWVLQKGTEIGVSNVVPMVTQRSLVRDTAMKPNKLSRWQSILTEAAEQSGRGRIPTLQAPITLDAAIQQAQSCDLALMPWVAEDSQTLRHALAEQKPKSVAIFIGPEGGFADEEVRHGRSHDIIPITLGPRTLRTETAGLVAAALVLHELGDMK